MKNHFVLGMFAAAVFVAPLFVAAEAHAGLSACGNIDVEASGTCEVKLDCSVDCVAPKFEAACSAQLEASCTGSCPQVPEVSCQGSCEGSCTAECNAKPAEFDCSAKCQADASAKCDAECATAADSTHCRASCEATFAGECDASCHGTPPSAKCDAKCAGRCEGSCTAQSKLKCQVDCQGKGYATCEAKLQGSCSTDCLDKKQGALFCQGQYIDHSGSSVNECIAAIRAALPTVYVDGSATGQSSCAGNTCQASGKAEGSVSCAFRPRTSGGGNVLGAFSLAGALGAALVRRRRQGPGDRKMLRAR